MNYTKLIITVLVASFCLCKASAQNYIFLDSDSGLHGAAHIATSQFDNVGILQAGYTFNGRLTLGTDLGQGNDRLNRVSSTIVRPYASYLVTKQSEEQMPILISTTVAYQYNILQTTSFSSSSLQFELGAYHSLDVGQSFDLIPFLRAGVRLDPRMANTTTESGTDFYYNGGITFRWTKLYVAPVITRASLNFLSYGVTIGYLFTGTQ